MAVDITKLRVARGATRLRSIDGGTPFSFAFFPPERSAAPDLGPKDDCQPADEKRTNE